MSVLDLDANELPEDGDEAPRRRGRPRTKKFVARGLGSTYRPRPDDRVRITGFAHAAPDDPCMRLIVQLTGTILSVGSGWAAVEPDDSPHWPERYRGGCHFDLTSTRFEKVGEA